MPTKVVKELDNGFTYLQKEGLKEDHLFTVYYEDDGNGKYKVHSKDLMPVSTDKEAVTIEKEELHEDNDLKKPIDPMKVVAYLVHKLSDYIGNWRDEG